MPRRLFFMDHHMLPLPPRHKFPIEKYRMVRELLQGDKRLLLEPAKFAGRDAIELVHDREYVESILNGTVSATVMRRIGFPWSEGLVKRTLASVGGTLAATDDALKVGWSGTLAGGTHHAFTAEGSGFCVFNDIAVAIRSLQSQAQIVRASVVDLDVHQGDGTAHIFYDDPNVFSFSVHCKNNFPLRKQHSKLDVELDSGVGDDEYLDTLARHLPKSFDFHPDIVFYQSGVDGLESDTLGHLALTADGLAERDRMVMTAVRNAGIPLVVTLGGGYSDPIALTAEAHAATFRIAAEVLGYA